MYIRGTEDKLRDVSCCKQLIVLRCFQKNYEKYVFMYKIHMKATYDLHVIKNNYI